LSICHGIVAEHGGQIYAKSQLGKGATFVVELPIKSP
jgi:two-component system NtrC family sensor kinase